MANQTIVLVENAFSRMQFPLHTIAADEEAANHEAFRVADGRRSPFDYWEPTTANASHNIKVTCDRVRAFTMIAIDRGHNLGGKQIVLECSDDDFSTTQTVLDIVLPSVSSAGTVDDTFGVRTEEGAWVRRFPVRYARYWRVRIPAMGAGIKPKIVGLWLGMAYGFEPDRPMSPDTDDLSLEESVSDAAWRGSGRPANVRADALHVSLPTLFDYDLARYHLAYHYARRRPMWIVHDENVAQQALLAIRPVGQMGFVREASWFYHRAMIPYQEHEAKPNG